LSSIHSGSKEGYALITDPYTPLVESSTFNCCHCQYLVHVHLGSGTKRGYCFLCNAATCGKPSCNKDCYPFMKKIEEAENRHRLHKALERGYDSA